MEYRQKDNTRGGPSDDAYSRPPTRGGGRSRGGRGRGDRRPQTGNKLSEDTP